MAHKSILIYDVSSTKSSESYDNECPICFNNINVNDPFYTMTCCNKNAHIGCLVDWYVNKHTNVICIMCNQKTNIRSELIFTDTTNIPIYSNANTNNTNITTLSEDNLVITIHDTSPQQLINNSNNLNNYYVCCKLIVTTIFIVLAIFITFMVIFL
jgi:hypothetical protein